MCARRSIREICIEGIEGVENEYQLTIIIPHHNIPDLLRKLLASIPKRNSIQMIVVDDHSTEYVDQLNAVIQSADDRNLEFYNSTTMMRHATVRVRAGISGWIMPGGSGSYLLTQMITM